MKKNRNNDPTFDSRSSNYHIPVLLNEVIDGLLIKPNSVYVDCTFGGGGHSKAILEKSDANSKLVAFDQDEEAGIIFPMMNG